MRLGLGISMLTHSSPPPSEGGGGEPEWLPDGATAFFDDANSRFYAAGSEQVRSWFVTGSSQDEFVMTANFLALFNENITHRFAFTLVPGNSGQLFELHDAATYGESSNVAYVYRQSDSTFKLEDYANLNATLSVTNPGANKIAINMFSDAGGGEVKAITSVNGSAANDSLSFPRPTWLSAYFGWGEEIGAFTGGGIVYTAFPLTAAEDLPALTAA